ncbi:xanthine dehydrogenase family protein molybdopterin-binding subunit [Desulforhopalus singaporensis]|uniref:Isoquinoline 1-oxidoreductase, beta subunit n=1 Tax=Desulforhopalus singaporensis TaxID=91360 RepID=A0A1H0T6K7_9BACT|nr:xanthine dehydrogenase family protein molybdopterin-binding subunit [Desulforhopalus singaporensis]SDP49687.1 isoquinoline 1-oxidoreductase, beta subunit [Desulforhopalus singaporensis]
MKTAMTRRTFLTKGSLVIAGTAMASQITLFNTSTTQATTQYPFKPHAFLEIAVDGTVTVWTGQTNLGQGSHTGIAMIIADELDAAWENVQVKTAIAAEPFKDPVWHAQATGGSTSIRHRWDLLRKVGSAGRQMLVEAAAERWGISADRCSAREGRVLHPDGHSLKYGELAEAAARRPVPDNPSLKSPQDYHIIGSVKKRLDIPDKVLGKTVYGFDFTLPDMCIAVVGRPPRFGAKVEGYDTQAALAIKGVLKVVPLENRVAVCAETTYGALQGRKALDIKWSEGSLPHLNDETLDLLFTDHLNKPGATAERSGDIAKALAQADRTIEQSYKLPYLSHAQVEPINCTAHVEKDRCRIWIPTQGQTATQHTAAKLTGLPVDKVEVMTTPAGGGFGLRGEQDPVVDSVLLAKILNRPVKVIFTREDDFANDYFRPASHCKITAGLDKEGRITGWSHQVAAPSVMSRVMAQYVENGVDADAVSGITDMVYSIPNKRVTYAMVNLPVSVGWWRSVGYSINTFTVESFMDELAHIAGNDPLAFRLAHMEKDSRAYNILSLLADKCGWGDSPSPGRARGIAVASCFESYAAHMAEVSVGKNGKITVHKVVCALDCGTAVHPDAIRAQAEGGVVMGLSAAFHEKIRFKNGGVDTANYYDYPVLSMSEVPEIEVYIAESQLKAGGIGEPVLPSVAPAVANGVFKATGVRLRELPFKTGLLARN